MISLHVKNENNELFTPKLLHRRPMPLLGQLNPASSQTIASPLDCLLLRLHSRGHSRMVTIVSALIFD